MPDPRLVALARELVRIPSVTTEGTRDAAALLRDEVLRDAGVEIWLEPGDAEGQVTLLAARGLGTKPPLLLNSHLDTVPPGDPAAWTECGGDPFAAVVRDGFLYGLGSADAKLDALCKATALRAVRDRPFARGVVFAGTWGEERGLLGARALLPRLPERPAAAWAGEPTELMLVTRHKGLLVVSLEAEAPGDTAAAAPTTRIRVTGRSAHSSTPHLGDNAIFRALDAVSARALPLVALSGGDAANKVPAACEIELLGEIAASAAGPAATFVGRSRGTALDERLSRFLAAGVAEVRRIAAASGRRDAAFDPPVRTASLGRAVAGHGRASFVADVRALPGDDVGEVRDAFEALAARFRDEGLSVRFRIERDNPPLDSDPASPPVTWSTRALAALGRPTAPATKAGCTEAGFYGASGIPSVVFGPGRSAGNVHRPNERVPLVELEGAVAFYTRLLEEACVA